MFAIISVTSIIKFGVSMQMKLLLLLWHLNIPTVYQTYMIS